MTFEGVIEHFSRGLISGWAAVVEDGQFRPTRVVLRLKFHGDVEPTQYVNREGGRTGFVFKLSDEIKAVSWNFFLESFDGVVARPAEPTVDAAQAYYSIPFFKSAFASFDDNNRTAIRAARLKDYSVGPTPNGRIAVFTIVYNEHLILPIWVKYYAEIFGVENLFVIDQGSSSPSYRSILPDGINVISVPRDQFDNWLIERLVATLQRFLLESYDSVLYTDSDEFVCLDPAVGMGVSLRQFLLELQEPIGITTGYDLVHELESEPPYDPEQPVLSQRKYLHRMPMMDKPVVSRVPLNWVPGFHNADEGGTIVKGLYLLHLRWFDLNFGLLKGGKYRDSVWNQFDVDKRLAEYQRDEADVIRSRFRSLAATAKEQASSSFDPNATFTSVPDWLKSVFTI